MPWSCGDIGYPKSHLENKAQLDKLFFPDILWETDKNQVTLQSQYQFSIKICNKWLGIYWRKFPQALAYKEFVKLAHPAEMKVGCSVEYKYT